MELSADSTMRVSSGADGCWNRIGVHGDSSCTQLAGHIHCRNCQVYAAAARDLLEARPPPDYLTHWTRQVALPGADRRTSELSLLIFRIAAEWFALSTVVLQEITGRRSLHTVPHRRDGAVMGLVNIRGEVMVCLSLQHILGVDVEPRPLGKPAELHERLVVMSHAGQRVVCPVDAVDGIERVATGAVTPVPATVAKATARYTRGVLRWKSHAVGVLDEQLLFDTMNRSLA